MKGIRLRLLIPLLLACAAIGAEVPAPAPLPAPAVAPAPAAAPAVDDATHMAAEIIRARALDAAGSGQNELSTQLQALAKGLLDGRVTLYDASLVMQIAATPRPAAPAPGGATVLTPEARASAQRAASLLDGDAPATAATKPAPPAVGAANAQRPANAPANAEQPPLSLPTLPAAPGKAITTKIYAIDNGSDGKALIAALGVGENNGVIVGQIFTIKRKALTVAQCKIIKVQASLSYAEILKNSLVDPKDDVKEGDQAVLSP